LMENTNWSEIAGNPAAPYINRTLLPAASFATRYFNPPGLHPSEPNYLWLEGGTHYGIRDNDDPAAHHLPNRDHLVSLLGQAGIAWKAYQEGISGGECPLSSEGLYAAKHNPFVYFDDVTGGLDVNSPVCISHVRPFEELAADLQVGKVGRYNFITPDLCHDMHGASACETLNQIHRRAQRSLPRLPVGSPGGAPALAASTIAPTWESTNPLARSPATISGSASAVCHPRRFMCITTMDPGRAFARTHAISRSRMMWRSGSPDGKSNSTVRRPVCPACSASSGSTSPYGGRKKRGMR